MPLDPTRNPYTPGAGQQPAVLTGREVELGDFEARLARLERGRSAQCTLLIGLRGVGKTVLLNRFTAVALGREWIVVEHELTAAGDLLGTVARLARQALFELEAPSRWRRTAQQVAALLRSMEMSYSIAGLSLNLPATDGGPGASGDRARDLTQLLVGLGELAQEHGRGVAFMFDELQFAETEPLGALVAALHRIAQRSLPVTAVAAGLPQTRGVLAEAASYAERMFETRTVGALTGTDAERALREPAREEDVEFTDDAIIEAVDFSEGYPFFLQVVGDHLWRVAPGSPIQRRDVVRAQPAVRAWLDRGFFTFRTDRLSTTQTRYLRAMAELGPGEQASGDVASTLKTSSASVGQTREALIKKGLIYSPRLGYAEFTVPQFDDYLRRHFELEPHAPRRRRPR